MIPLYMQSMTGAGMLPLLEAVAITVAALALLMVVARLFYFSAALGMQDATGHKVRMSDAELRKATRSSGVRASLRHREIVTILRTPAMITNGYLYSIVLPLVLMVPLFFRFTSSLQ